MPAELELSIVIPCLNEERSLPSCIRDARAFLDAEGVSGEVIVADNGSTDASVTVASNAGARVVNEPRRGYGQVLMAGMEAAQGRYIIMGDADGSYDFRALRPMLERLREGCDLVIGDRFAGGIEKGAMPWLHRHLGNPVLSGIGRTFFRIKIRDFHCGLRGITRQCFTDINLHCTGMEFASEMIVKSALAGKKIGEVPVNLSRDKRERPSHLDTWPDGWRHLRFLLLYSPRWLFLYPALTLIGLGILFSALILAGPVRIGGTRLDIHSLAYFSASILIGFQLLATYVLAQVYAFNEKLLPMQDPFVAWVRKRFTLEKGLLVGALLLAIGLALNIRSIAYWEQRGFGDLDPVIVSRWVTSSVTLLVLGAQWVGSSFYLSLLLMGKKNE